MGAEWLNTGLGREFLHSLKRIADGLMGVRVDGHGWSKRDEIALGFWKESAMELDKDGLHPVTCYKMADKFLEERKTFLDEEKARRG